MRYDHRYLPHLRHHDYMYPYLLPEHPKHTEYYIPSTTSYRYHTLHDILSFTDTLTLLLPALAVLIDGDTDTVIACYGYCDTDTVRSRDMVL